MPFGLRHHLSFFRLRPGFSNDRKGPPMEPLGREHTRRTRMILAEEGTELTIDEIMALRKSAFAKIREEMRKRGYDVPDDDKEFFLYMKSLGL